MENYTINTLHKSERVTSTYADIYFNNDDCKSDSILNDDNITNESDSRDVVETEWISPSDLLIGKVELEPPFTSKITRGKTHEGILAIGNEIVEKEHKHFLASLNVLLQENDESWNHMLENEKQLINKKVKEIFENIFNHKSKIMNIEIMKFYESTLQSLETHLQSEVEKILNSVHASMTSTLNIEIPKKLKKEKAILEDVLKKKYKMEVGKISIYYKLLLNNELYNNNKAINCALNNRNTALQTFCRQIDAKRLTTCMYIMSIERKKCRIKKMFLENYQSAELSEKLTKIKKRQAEIEAFKEREQTVSDINTIWENKMKKILELFVKFVSFSLKLLPEQSNFLLDFQKMVVLQLSEIQRHPNVQQSILIDEDKFIDFFQFETALPDNKVCDLKPFTIEGDISDPVPPRYGSTETLCSNVDLPFIRVNRQYTYAKCHGYEDIKKMLKSQQCKCERPPSPIIDETLPTLTEQPAKPSTSNDPIPPKPTTSTLEPLLIGDVSRLEECPARKCGYWGGKNLYQFLPAFLDFTEKQFERVKAIADGSGLQEKAPDLIKAKDIARKEIPFAKTTEKYRHVETQYSTEELNIENANCTCVNEYKVENVKSIDEMKGTPNQMLTEALTKRKVSLMRLLDQNPNLLKIFTNESFDFQL